MLDVTTLDWSRWYLDRNSWPHSDQLFLAEAVLQLAPLMIWPWDDAVVPATMAKEAPLLPGTADAFHLDGSPKPAVHAAWAPAILDYVSAAEFTSYQLERADPKAWLEAHVYDPAAGAMRFDESKAYTSGTDVSFQHWDHAAWEAAEINELRRSGITSMPLLARAVAEMAIKGDIRTFARPIHGGPPVDLGPEDWHLDVALGRIASCSLDMNDRFNMRADPTHLIFVGRDDFGDRAALYAKEHMVSLWDEGITPADFVSAEPSGRELYGPMKRKAYIILKEHLQAHPERYRRNTLRRVLRERLGDVQEGVFEAVRRRLREEYPHIAEGGAPPRDEREG